MSDDARVSADSDETADTESDATVDVDGDDEDTERQGTVEDTTPPPQDEHPDDSNGDETVPAVELDLYDLSVRVSGQSTDDLDSVSETARGLMEYLVEQSHVLEDHPDDRGLS